MQRILMWIVIVVFVVAMLGMMVTYSVRFTETAVVTFFGKAGENDVKKDPGLYFKWPYPFESVTKYDKRVRLLSVKLETQQTADSRQVVVEGFCTWRVSDPLKFFQRFSNQGARAEDHYRAAERALQNNLRASMALVSRYRIDELFNSSTDATKIGELETKMLEAFRSSADQSRLSIADYGIEAVDVGLSRIVLPEKTTEAVFQRMQQNVNRIADETDARGNSQAQQIRSQAESEARRISEFAERLAQEIRLQGDREAAPFLGQMNKNKDLAVFLETMNFVDQAYGKKTTLILSGSMPGVSMLFPNALDGLKSGEIPRLHAPEHWLARAMNDASPLDESPKPNTPGTTLRDKERP